MGAFAVITGRTASAIPAKIDDRPVSSIVTVTHQRVSSAAAAHHSGLLRFSVNEENMMLKLILILS